MLIRYTDAEYNEAKSQDLLALGCEHCGKTFYTSKKSIKYELQHQRGRLKYCSRECCGLGQQTIHKCNCTNCGTEIDVIDNVYRKSLSKHFFCCSSCSATYNNKLRGHIEPIVKQKIAKSVTEHYNKVQRHKHICRVCGKEYNTCDEGATRVVCSKNCSKILRENRKKFLSEDTISKLRQAGLKSVSVQSDKRRSMNEAYFCKLCEEHFNQVRHNEPIFNGWDADIIIDDIKYAILWNGKWHYENISSTQSLEQIQNRDKIKLNEICNCGYTPYVIKDMGKYNKNFVDDEFVKFLKNLKKNH